MYHQGGAQGNADIRSPRDTGISDAWGVEPEAPKGGKRSDLWERESGDSCRREWRAGAAAATEREEARGAMRGGVDEGVKKGRAAGGGDATRGAFTSGGDFLDGDAEASGLVDEVVGDARTGERDHALGQEV